MYEKKIILKSVSLLWARVVLKNLKSQCPVHGV
jgi:hypothetical protein